MYIYINVMEIKNVLFIIFKYISVEIRNLRIYFKVGKITGNNSWYQIQRMTVSFNNNI